MSSSRRLAVTSLFAAALCWLPVAAAAATISLYTTKASFDLAVTTTLIEDFEGVSPKDTPLASLVHNGITFTPFAGTPFANVWVASPGYTNFGPGVPQPTDTSILVANGDEDFLVTLPGATHAIGFDRYLNGLGNGVITYFNGATTVATVTFSGFNDKGYVGLYSPDSLFTAFRWTTVDGGRLNTGIDNISIAPTEVPEPASMLLIASGMGWLSVRRRQRSQR